MAHRALSFSRRLVGFAKMKTKIETVTGLLIRMPEAAQAYRIGGADLFPMVTRKRYRIDGVEVDLEVPFIPGSSLKGRMRALVELALGLRLYSTDGKIWSHTRSLSAMSFEDFTNDVTSRCPVDELFGWAAANYKQIEDEARRVGNVGIAQQVFGLLAPTRLLFSDFYPAEDYVGNLRPTSLSDFLEEKPENRIDRVTSAADPREVVRVRPGVVFEGAINLLLFDIDKVKLNEYVSLILDAMDLLENTYLGGSGSRGYGRVRFLEGAIDVVKVKKQGSGDSLLEKKETVRFSNLSELKGRKQDLVKSLASLFE